MLSSHAPQGWRGPRLDGHNDEMHKPSNNQQAEIQKHKQSSTDTDHRFDRHLIIRI